MTDTPTAAIHSIPERPPVARAAPPQRPDEATAARLAALANRGSTGSSGPRTGPAAKTEKRSGPPPSRIIAAAASVSAGIGLVALMAGGARDVVVEVNPTPVVVQPANVVIQMPATADAAVTQNRPVEVRMVEAAVPATRPAPTAQPVAQSQGS